MEWISSLLLTVIVKKAKHPSSTHAKIKFWILVYKCGNNPKFFFQIKIQNSFLCMC